MVVSVVAIECPAMSIHDREYEYVLCETNGFYTNSSVVRKI